MDRTLIEKLIAKHEGTRTSVYKDSRGILTIGIGWNLEAADSVHIAQEFGLDIESLKAGTMIMSDAQVDEVFGYQLNKVIGQAAMTLPNFYSMPDSIQAVVCDLIFNLGWGGFQEFRQTIAALKVSDWQAAAEHLKDSKWFTQVGTRGTDDVGILEAM